MCSRQTLTNQKPPFYYSSSWGQSICNLNLMPHPIILDLSTQSVSCCNIVICDGFLAWLLLVCLPLSCLLFTGSRPDQGSSAVTCQLPTNYLLTIYQLSTWTTYLLIIYWLSTYYILTIYWISTNYELQPITNCEMENVDNQEKTSPNVLDVNLRIIFKV